MRQVLFLYVPLLSTDHAFSRNLQSGYDGALETKENARSLLLLVIYDTYGSALEEEANSPVSVLGWIGRLSTWRPWTPLSDAVHSAGSRKRGKTLLNDNGLQTPQVSSSWRR
jgi:hypothetical protein